MRQDQGTSDSGPRCSDVISATCTPRESWLCKAPPPPISVPPWYNPEGPPITSPPYTSITLPLQDNLRREAQASLDSLVQSPNSLWHFTPDAGNQVINNGKRTLTACDTEFIVTKMPWHQALSQQLGIDGLSTEVTMPKNISDNQGSIVAMLKSILSKATGHNKADYLLHRTSDEDWKDICSTVQQLITYGGTARHPVDMIKLISSDDKLLKKLMSLGDHFDNKATCCVTLGVLAAVIDKRIATGSTAFQRHWNNFSDWELLTTESTWKVTCTAIFIAVREINWQDPAAELLSGEVNASAKAHSAAMQKVIDSCSHILKKTQPNTNGGNSKKRKYTDAEWAEWESAKKAKVSLLLPQSVKSNLIPINHLCLASTARHLPIS